tara:strand:+ start:1083 stop:3164 length:2082 start_codon:yes stop_codon:yes gene_type:complete
MTLFPFRFLRSRFRRKSLKKIGGVTEEPLHVLPNNGGRTDGVLFEFQGEIAESASIENILERQLRQAEFSRQTDEISRISDTLKALQSRPSQLTKEQCEDIKTILRQQKQSLIEASDPSQQSLKINAFFDNQGLQDQKLSELVNSQFSTFDEQVALERSLTNGVSRLIAVLDNLGKSRVLNLSSFITNNSAGRLARMQLLIGSEEVSSMVFGDKLSPSLISRYAIIEETERLETLSPRQLLEAKGFSFSSELMYCDLDSSLDLDRVLELLRTQPGTGQEISKNSDDLDSLIEDSLLSFHKNKMAQHVDYTVRYLIDGIQPAIETCCYLFSGLTFIRLVRNLYGGGVGDITTLSYFDSDNFYDEEFVEIVFQELINKIELSPDEYQVYSRKPIRKELISEKLDTLQPKMRQQILDSAYSKYLILVAKISSSQREGYIKSVKTSYPIEIKFRTQLAIDEVDELELQIGSTVIGSEKKTNIFEDLASLGLIWTRLVESSVVPALIEVVQIDLLKIKLKAGLDKFKKELQLHDSKEKTDRFLERNKAMIKFAQEIQEARQICIESTDRLLKKRALGFDPEDTSSIRSNLKDRLSLMSNRFLSVIGETMSGQCDTDGTQFRLDFSEGGDAVKLIDIDTATVGETVTDIQRLFGELEAIFSERDTTRIDFQSDWGGEELASTRASKPTNPKDDFEELVC